MINSSAESAAAAIIAPASQSLVLSYDSAINYAFQQNAIPVVKELRFQNDDVARKDVVIRVSTEPAFAAPVEIRIQAINPLGEFRVAPLDLKLSHDFLASLNERVAGWLKVEVLEGETVVCERTEAVSLLARNEWCGLVSLPEILAAFILPNDPAVMPILGRAAELLRESTGQASLNGYQDKNRQRAWEQVAAIYKAIAELGIRYINPPASFENTGQKIRFPGDVVAQRFGTCLDLALLVAACCEQVGLRPFVFMHEGHAYAGCWLEERSSPEPADDNLQQVRKLATDSLITVFETTMLTNERPGTLADAERVAQPHLTTELPFRLALDVHRARLARIHPLPIPGASAAAAESTGLRAGTEAVSKGIGSRTFGETIAPELSGEAKAATRIDSWKSRLLDLSLRNRLLNFRETKSTIRILSAAPELVEDELAAERELALRPKPRVMSENDPRNAATYSDQQRKDALLDHLRDELEHGRLHTHLDEPEHARRLTDLFRAARNALDENGTNTLFAAVGFLEWRETVHSDRVHRAPLLLVPVELKRKSVMEGFSLRRIDEETRLNVTLMEMLRQNFRKEIPGLDPLPEDDNGVNVGRVFQIFRDAVQQMVGWEVKSEVWLGQFSFTKFLLWKDLTDRLDDLTRNRVVNHLVNEAGTPYPNPPDDVHPRELDDRFHPREIFCPRSADSSQLAAVMAAAAGHDFVLEGPPGTGKSQTITNIIAHCLAEGKRVLFVAEKRAALDVVHRRLREDGLEPFCLELHSNKIGKADVLAQFDRSLKYVKASGAGPWEAMTQLLKQKRDELNAYSFTLHHRFPCGLSAFDCLDFLIPRRDQSTVGLADYGSVSDTATERLEELRQLAKLLGQRSRAVMPLIDHPLSELACEDWSPAWAERVQELIRRVPSMAQAVKESVRDLRAWLGSPGDFSTRDQLHSLLNLVDALRVAQPVGPAFATTPWNQLAADLELWWVQVTERDELRLRLRQVHFDRSAPYARLPCEKWTDDSVQNLLNLAPILKSQIPDLFASAQVLSDWPPRPEPVAALVQRRIDTAAADGIERRQSVTGPLFDEKQIAGVKADHARYPHLLRSRRAELVRLLSVRPENLRSHPASETPAAPTCEDKRAGSSVSVVAGSTPDSIAVYSIGQLRGLAVLADQLHSAEDMEAKFFSVSWAALDSGLGDWIAWTNERAELRVRLNGIHSGNAVHAQSVCETWESSRLDENLVTATELASLTRELSIASRTLRATLRSPRVESSSDELFSLSALSDCLASPLPVPGKFVETAWPNWSQRFERWIESIEERQALRQRLVAYDEAKLLDFDLIALKQEWDLGRSSWFLSRWLRGRRIARQLKIARSDHVAPTVAELDGILSAAHRLRELNCEIENVREDAEAVLGSGIWNRGEPDVTRLLSIRDWGRNLHARLLALAGDDTTWLENLLRSIAGLLEKNSLGLGSKTSLVRQLNRFRESFEKFDEAYDSFIATAIFDRQRLDDAEDHLGEVAIALETFVKSAPQLRTINAQLEVASPKARGALGELWRDGEPVSQSLANVRRWGAILQAALRDISGDDTGRIEKLRHLCAAALEEKRQTALAGVVTNALMKFRAEMTVFDQAYDSFATAAELNRSDIERARDHAGALRVALDTFIEVVPVLRAINTELSAVAPIAEARLGVLWSGGEPPPDVLERIRLWGADLHSGMVACAGDDFLWLSQLRKLLASMFAEGPTAYGPETVVGKRLLRYRDALTAFETGMDAFAGEVSLRRGKVNDASNYLSAVVELAERLTLSWGQIREWISWQKVRRTAFASGLQALVVELEGANGGAIDSLSLFERSFRKSLLNSIIEQEPVLREFFGREHGERIERFRELDKKVADATAKLVAARLAAAFPHELGNSVRWNGESLPRTTRSEIGDRETNLEFGLLRKEIGKKKRHIPVRQLIGRIPTLLSKLKPCVLMSPLSVAQYLEASHEAFDVVIFDEASQIPVWDAVGAIARGKQLIVVGDPKQLPPTNFFNSSGDDEDDRTPEEHKDLESILDELMTNGLRHKRLQWHYRSRHEGLITFSNRQYYDNHLLTFPSPEAELGGVKFRHLPKARYDKGKSRTNKGEAEALVKELVTRLRGEGGPRRSYGVVTFSQAQQQLVENLLDEERRKHPEIEVHFGDAPPVEGEPVFVKNLENVQGDERDVIFFSICYGPDENGKLSMNFGPLNRDGGERRLNVAVTRAKHEVVVFSGLKADQIDLTRTRALGVRDLKYFLDYADRGPKALSAMISATGDTEADSEFERLVADRIRAAGYEVHHQVGCSGYRIDLGVLDPKRPGRYLLGVECDGATYHRAATARDRDKLRQAVLEDLGWQLHRIWSTDWWHDPDKEMDKLLGELGTLSAVTAEKKLNTSC